MSCQTLGSMSVISTRHMFISLL